MYVKNNTPKNWIVFLKLFKWKMECLLIYTMAKYRKGGSAIIPSTSTSNTTGFSVGLCLAALFTLIIVCVIVSCVFNHGFTRPSYGFVSPLNTHLGSSSLVSTPIIAPDRPITIDTRPTFEPVEQLGVLTSKDGNEILPLMGRKFAFNRGGRYEYFTMSGSHGMLSPLPVLSKGKNCSGEHGCDEVFDGDSLMTGGTKKEYNATMYDTTPYYRPL